jgi:hypothetical protein
MNASKSICTKWCTSTLKSLFNMSMTVCGPLLNRPLICTCRPLVGSVTSRSRGNETSRFDFVAGSMWSTIITSARCPPCSAGVPNAWAWAWSCTNARVSEPMMR